MYPFYPLHQLQQQQQQQQFFPWYNPPFVPHPAYSFQAFQHPQYSPVPPQLTNTLPSILNRNSTAISNSDLINLLNDRSNELKRLQDKDQQQQLPILIDLITTLRRIPRSVLVSEAQKESFSLLRTPLTDILERWRRYSFLSDNETFILRTTAKLIHRLIKAVDDIKLLPRWLSDSTLLDTIALCLTDIATSAKFLDNNNQQQFKHFTRLIGAYILYQQRLNVHSHLDKDTFVQLLDPILQCLTSTHFIQTFTNLQLHTNSMTTIQKFFLLKCPAFLISYNGSRLQQTMDSLLSLMMSHYVQLLDKLIPLTHNWNRSIIQSVELLLETINHGADQFDTNAKIISVHLSLIDHVLQLVNEPLFYDHLDENLSNAESSLMNTAIRFLVNMINEPIILAHVKQSHVVSRFLRLTSCRYEPLVLNVYTLLAYTTHEDDIKTIQNLDRLLSTIIQSLKSTLNEKSEKKTPIEQLLETLKGLVQHDQIKDEIIKQNVLPFLLELTDKFSGKVQTVIFEILWSLAFRDDGALILRSNENFLKTIQTISKSIDNESLKKAADGLVWKLIREPLFLEKVAKQEAEKKISAQQLMETAVQEVVNSGGEKQLITTIKPPTNETGERIFQYDIMISYCHADKELTYKIHKFLVAQGFIVWIDLDNIHGPAMSAMADAVENSEFILLCMSDSYKQSAYCQAEAEYAFKCKRRLIPLIMRQGYRPDGWLGFMIGSRIYIDFGRYDFDIGCEKLMTEISLQRKRPLPAKVSSMDHHEKPGKITSSNNQSSASHHEKSLDNTGNNTFSVYTKRTATSNFNRKPLNQWTESDVLDFLMTERLIPMMPLCETMNGRALIQLYRMCISRSSRMYVLLSNELQSTYKTRLPIGVFTRFLSSMEQRLNIPLQTPSRAMLQYADTVATDFPQDYVSYTSSIPSVDSNSSQYRSYSDKPYDLVITSNASAIEVLRTVERFGLNYARTALTSA